MKISRRHWIVRYAYFGRPHVLQQRITLCELFWQSIATTYLCVCMPLMALSGYAILWAQYPGAMSGIHVLGAAVAVVVYLSIKCDQWLARRRAAREAQPHLQATPPSLLRESYRAVKQRVCPLIEIEH